MCRDTPSVTMAQSGPVPVVQPRRHRPESHPMEPSNGAGGPPVIQARFNETDWEARDVSGIRQM